MQELIDELKIKIIKKENGRLNDLQEGFNNGLRFALEHIEDLLEKEREQQHKWINVEDTLPKQESKYLINDGECLVAWYKNKKWRAIEPTEYSTSPYLNTKFRQTLFPTHWMLLPQPPKE